MKSRGDPLISLRRFVATVIAVAVVVAALTLYYSEQVRSASVESKKYRNGGGSGCTGASECGQSCGG